MEQFLPGMAAFLLLCLASGLYLFSYRFLLTRVVLEKGPLNGCVCDNLMTVL